MDSPLYKHSENELRIAQNGFSSLHFLKSMKRTPLWHSLSNDDIGNLINNKCYFYYGLETPIMSRAYIDQYRNTNYIVDSFIYRCAIRSRWSRPTARIGTVSENFNYFSETRHLGLQIKILILRLNDSIEYMYF